MASSSLVNVPQNTDMFGNYNSELGILKHPPGITIVSIRYRLDVFAAAALFVGYTWGFIVADDDLPATGMDPLTDRHLDWMEWGAASVLVGPSPLPSSSLVGGGDDGFRTVRSQRKMKEMRDALFFVIRSDSATTTTFALQASVHFKLP